MKKTIFLALLVVAWMASCKHEILNPGGVDPNPSGNGSGSNGSICFESDVLPIFQSNCAKSGCHDVATQAEGYVLDTYSNIVRRGISPGNAAGSKLYTVLFAGGEEQMPQGSAPLTDTQKKLIAQWINEGALNTTGCDTQCDTTQFNYAANVAPILSVSCTGCHNNSLANGGVDLSSYNGVKAAVPQIPAAIQWLNTNTAKNMPQPPASQLPSCDITVILKWINAGAQNN